MSDIKFTLLHQNSHYAVGVTNMKNYLNRPLHAGGCTLFVCNEGVAVVSINFRKRVVRAGELVFIFSDMVFVVVRTSRLFSAFYCTVSVELLNESTYNIPWDFYELLYINPVCKTTEVQYAQLKLWQQQLEWFISEQGQGQGHIYSFVRNSLQNLFMGVDREMKRDQNRVNGTQRKDRAWALMTRFFLLLVEHCKEQRSVRFYADKLCITPYYLYKITDKIMKLSPKELIDEQIVVEIKMHLTCTNMSVKEIAEKLCFEDPSYMCRFFRRNTGKSLTEYKSEFI